MQYMCTYLKTGVLLWSTNWNDGTSTTDGADQVRSELQVGVAISRGELRHLLLYGFKRDNVGMPTCTGKIMNTLFCLYAVFSNPWSLWHKPMQVIKTIQCTIIVISFIEDFCIIKKSQPHLKVNNLINFHSRHWRLTDWTGRFFDNAAMLVCWLKF